MTIATERGNGRVVFENPLDVRVLAIDGTWCIDGQLIDVSDTEARIKLASPAAKDIRFYLLLTKFGGPVFRMCIRKWVKGTLMEVSFESAFCRSKTFAQLGAKPSLTKASPMAPMMMRAYEANDLGFQ